MSIFTSLARTSIVSTWLLGAAVGVGCAKSVPSSGPPPANGAPVVQNPAPGVAPATAGGLAGLAPADFAGGAFNGVAAPPGSVGTPTSGGQFQPPGIAPGQIPSAPIAGESVPGAVAGGGLAPSVPGIPAAAPGVPPGTPGVPGQAAPAPGSEFVPAKAGVGIKGRSLDQHEGVIVTPAKTLFSAREQIVFNIAIPQALNLYKASNGEAPRTHDEFMTKIVQEQQITLPQLPAGHRYVYDPQTEQLMVERPKK